MTVSRHFPKFGLSPNSIFSPNIDLIFTSGLSILTMTFIVIFYFYNPNVGNSSVENILPKILILQALINWPHFIVSYRLLYGKRQNFIDFPMATIAVPLLLIIFCVGSAIPYFGGNGLLSLNVKASYFLWLFSSLYLAWHYVGQTWGVMAIYSGLSNTQFKSHEKILIRGGLYSLILWHVIWGIQTLPKMPILALFQNSSAQLTINILCLAAFIIGIFTFLFKSMKSKIDIRVFGAWVVIYLWYLVLFLMPAAFVFIQLSHALQYLIFPARIEVNRNNSLARHTRMASLRLFFVYIISVTIGLIVFYIPEFLFSEHSANPTLPALLAIAINIHHYYTDSAIWKSRKDGIKKDLFTHINLK